MARPPLAFVSISCRRSVKKPGSSGCLLVQFWIPNKLYPSMQLPLKKCLEELRSSQKHILQLVKHGVTWLPSWPEVLVLLLLLGTGCSGYGCGNGLLKETWEYVRYLDKVAEPWRKKGKKQEKKCLEVLNLSEALP